jgi:hypothetical protein
VDRARRVVVTVLSLEFQTSVPALGIFRSYPEIPSETIHRRVTTREHLLHGRSYPN